MGARFILNDLQQKAFDYFVTRGFLPVDKDAYPVFKRYDGGDNLLGEMTATVAVIWGFEYYALYKVMGGYLCSLWFFRHDPDYYFEVNRPSRPDCSLSDLISALYTMTQEAGLSCLRIYSVNEENLKEFQNIPGFDIETDYSGDRSEYFYKVKDLMELTGSVNFYKRKRLKRCFSLDNISIKPITGENINLVLGVHDKWCEHQDCDYCRSFVGCERKALEIMVSIYNDKEKTGLLLYEGDVPAGYIICEQINKKVSYLYQGKAVIQDFFIYLIYMMYKDYLPDVEYMDLNEDMGHEGLRMFKRHLSVYELWRKYLLTYGKQ
ncbi:MAG: phosphatidylglycerol lysyltransferase domain-containing protein [Treponema sp.]|jgi:hypothetical protein|nr:phosphatidylglycerol lysyltransferase domain-containing protein [Treponema sp.]